MKRIVFLISLVCIALSISAQTINSRSRITFKTDGEANRNVRLLLSDDFSNGWDNTWDANPAQEGGIYVYYQDAKYSIWASNEYSANLQLGFVSTNNLEYTLSFDLFTGTSYEIYDRVADQTIVVNGSTADYNFTIDASDKNKAINDRFVINPSATVTSVTTGADGWASFAYNADLALAYPAGLTIYKGAYNDDPANPAIALTPVADIPADAGVFVKGEANTTYYFAATTATADMTGNDIVGCVDATPVSTFSGKDIYTLRYANGATALYQYTGTADIPAGKAVLPINAGGPIPAPKRIALQVNGTQGVENVQFEAAPVEKFIENGQVLIKRGENIYNLQGQMVK